MVETGFAYSSQMVTILTGIAIQSCLAWFLGPAGRGSYAVCLVFGYILGILVSLGIDGALQYYVASKKLNISQCISFALVIAIILGLLGMLLGFVMLEIKVEFFTKASRQAFTVALLYIPVSVLDAIFTKLFIGLREFKWLGIFSLIKGGVNLISIVIALYFLSSGVVGALLAITLSWLITIILELIYIHKKYHFRLQWLTKKQVSEVFNYGKRFYFTRLGNVMNSQIGTVILAFFLQPSDIGYYAVATKLGAYIIIIPDAVGNVLLSRIIMSNNGRSELVARCSRICGIICGMAIIFLLCTIKPLVLILLSPSFLPIIPLVWLLSPGVFIRCPSKIMIPYFNGTNRPEISSLATIAGVSANLLALLLLLPLLGLKGGALAMTLGYITSSIILVAYFIKLSDISMSALFHFKKTDLFFLKG